MEKVKFNFTNLSPSDRLTLLSQNPNIEFIGGNNEAVTLNITDLNEINNYNGIITKFIFLNPEISLKDVPSLNVTYVTFNSLKEKEITRVNNLNVSNIIFETNIEHIASFSFSKNTNLS